MSEKTMRPEPHVDEHGIPRCHDDCSQHDGKRCRILGFRPDGLCEPAVFEMAQQIKAADELVRRLQRGEVSQ